MQICLFSLGITHIRPPGSVGKGLQKLKDFLILSDSDGTHSCFIPQSCVKTEVSFAANSLSIATIVYKTYSALIYAEVLTARV